MTLHAQKYNKKKVSVVQNKRCHPYCPFSCYFTAALKHEAVHFRTNVVLSRPGMRALWWNQSQYVWGVMVRGMPTYPAKRWAVVCCLARQTMLSFRSVIPMDRPFVFEESRLGKFVFKNCSSSLFQANMLAFKVCTLPSITHFNWNVPGWKLLCAAAHWKAALIVLRHTGFSLAAVGWQANPRPPKKKKFKGSENNTSSTHAYTWQLLLIGKTGGWIYVQRKHHMIMLYSHCKRWKKELCQQWQNERKKQNKTVKPISPTASFIKI